MIYIVCLLGLFFFISMVMLVHFMFEDEATEKVCRNFAISYGIILFPCVLYSLIQQNQLNKQYKVEVNNVCEQWIIHDGETRKRIVMNRGCDSNNFDTISISDWNPDD